MADSVVIQVADAVVANLNAGSFDPAFTAQRQYRPAFDLAALDELRISVVPKSLQIANASRGVRTFDVSIDIGVQQKVDADDVANLDDLMGLVEQIGDHLSLNPLAEMPEAVFVSITNEPIFAPEHLDQQRVFTSVLTVVYQIGR